METTNLESAIQFIISIGIEVKYRRLDDDTFLPGLLIEDGCICIDLDKLKYPGDILHEAGHIAVVPKSERKSLNGPTIATRKENGAEEMMAIAWSYAACKHLQINPYFVFHEDGYKGGGSSMADQFDEGRYFGVSTLQWVGMTIERRSEENQTNIYPEMIKWLRE